MEGRDDRLLLFYKTLIWYSPEYNRKGAIAMKHKARISALCIAGLLLSGCVTSGGGGNLAATAKKYEGTNPTGRSSLWCADFINLVLRESGDSGTRLRASRSFLQWGEPAPDNCINCIAVFSRGKNKDKGHVGVVIGRDAQGNPIVVSGNHNHMVGEATYPKERVLGYRLPKVSRALMQQSSL